MSSLADIPRNDLEAVEAFYVAQGKVLASEEYRVIWKLQDDPAAFDLMATDWNIAEPVELD